MSILTDLPSVVVISGAWSGKNKKIYRLDCLIDTYWLIKAATKSKPFMPNVPSVGVISGAGKSKNAKTCQIKNKRLV